MFLILLGQLFDRFKDIIIVLSLLFIGWVLYLILFINYPYAFAVVWGAIICAIQYYRYHNC